MTTPGPSGTGRRGFAGSREDQPPEATSPLWSSPSSVLLPEPSGVARSEPLSVVTEEEVSSCSSVCVVVPSSSVEVLS
ncbi:hypothetical protein DZF97_13710 [Clavibacter nebraskensis]|uniref:Uncharacterized protein n=2 Tax=Clavibacter nebraskensis TaxID=31963 RepID=A0AAI8ZIG7_9MICO|nr:hypothetical protein DZF97_13710 [Clavibacter nebraskensis]UKF27055.1 hypothetical protein FGQ65_01740 [Clavibacter nebraskensis]CCE75538.1 hypothetical protein CMN_01592 [Clavibacter nebraskensis NCPPB 2581]